MSENGHVSQDQCDDRRNHLSVALAKTVDRIRDDQKEFWAEIKADLKAAAATLAETAERTVRMEERSKSNTHRLNRGTKITIGVVIGLLMLAAKIIIGVF